MAERYGSGGGGGGGGGSPLPGGLAARFGASLGTDLSGVRLHTGPDAADEAAALGARAFASGDDVFFGAGQYAPGTPDGDWMIAHEVAHTVQQRGGGGDPALLGAGAARGGSGGVEADADRAADAMLAGRPAAVTAAPRGAYRIPESAVRPEPTVTPDVLGHLRSSHWHADPALLTETVRIPGASSATGQPIEVTGQFVRSRYVVNGRPSAMPRDGAGQLALDPNTVGDDVGAMPRFIENHPAIARMWGLRLEHNADGLTTHVVTPTPETFRRLRAAIQGSEVADLAPRTSIRGVDHELDGPEFAQSLRVGAPPVSLSNGRLYHHDWLQHMPGFLTLGPHTRSYLSALGFMVADVQAIAARHSAQHPGAPLHDALVAASDAVATTGALIEAQVTYLGQAMAAPTDRIDRAELVRRYEQVWGDEALNNPPATAARAGLPADQQGFFDAAVAEMRARQARVQQETAAVRAQRAALIAQDVDGALQMMQRGDAVAAESTITVMGRRLSLFDERRLAIDLEELAAAGQLDAALAEVRAQHAALRTEVQSGQRERRAVQQHGAEASGPAVPSDADRAGQRRLEALDALVPRIEALARGTGDGAREAFLRHFEDVGLRMLGGLMHRAEVRRLERDDDVAYAHLRNRPARSRPAEEQLAVAQIAAARSALGAGFVWTDPQVFAAVSRAVELSSHPVRARWVREEHARRQPPAESHLLRNVLLGSLVVVALVTGTLLVAEALEGAGAAAAVFTTEGAAATTGATGAAATTTTGAAATTVTGVRVVVDAVRVGVALEQLALEAGAGEAAAAALAL